MEISVASCAGFLAFVAVYMRPSLFCGTTQLWWFVTDVSRRPIEPNQSYIRTKAHKDFLNVTEESDLIRC
jgi:hypothetical protein